MSKLSRFFIGVIITGLAFIASVNLYRAYEKHVADSQEHMPPATQTFNQVPVQYVPAEPEIPVYKKYDDVQRQEIYLEDQPLAPEVEAEQARQTVKSILADYQEDPALQQFYQSVRQATGEDIRLEDLSGESLPSLLQKYPQLSDVISRHAQDPAFAQKLQEIFSNPQFMRSVAVLQNNPHQPRK